MSSTAVLFFNNFILELVSNAYQIQQACLFPAIHLLPTHKLQHSTCYNMLHLMPPFLTKPKFDLNNSTVLARWTKNRCIPHLHGKSRTTHLQKFNTKPVIQHKRDTFCSNVLTRMQQYGQGMLKRNHPANGLP